MPGPCAACETLTPACLPRRCAGWSNRRLAARAASRGISCAFLVHQRSLEGVEVGQERHARGQKCLKRCGKERHKRKNGQLSKYCTGQANSTPRILPTLSDATPLIATAALRV